MVHPGGFGGDGIGPAETRAHEHDRAAGVNVAMGIVVTLPLIVVGSFLLGQGFPNPNPRRARIVGSTILLLLLVAEFVWIGASLAIFSKH